MSAGCATVGDHRVEAQYQRASSARGGYGEFYLVEEALTSDGSTTVQWVLGDIMNNDGEKIGNSVTDTAPTDILVAALVQEFDGAGYNTIRVNAMPKGAKGLVLKKAYFRLDEVKTPFIVVAESKVKIEVVPWRNGKAMKKMEYEAEYSDTAVTDRDELVSNALPQAISTIMKQSVSKIVRMIEL